MDKYLNTKNMPPNSGIKWTNIEQWSNFSPLGQSRIKHAGQIYTSKLCGSLGAVVGLDDKSETFNIRLLPQINDLVLRPQVCRHKCQLCVYLPCLLVNVEARQ